MQDRVTELGRAIAKSALAAATIGASVLKSNRQVNDSSDVGRLSYVYAVVATVVVLSWHRKGGLERVREHRN